MSQVIYSVTAHGVTLFVFKSIHELVAAPGSIFRRGFSAAVLWCAAPLTAGVCDMQAKTSLSRMTRERENVNAQLTLSEQTKHVAEDELVEVIDTAK